MFLTECDAFSADLKGVRFADLASLVKPKYFITNLSNAVLFIWFIVLLVLVLFLTVFTFYLFCDIGSDGIVTLWERAARAGYNMFSVPCQVLTRATFIIVDCMIR